MNRVVVEPIVENIFITKKEKLRCKKCGDAVPKGQRFVAESEKNKGLCFSCSPFAQLAFLPAGDAAMTRRSKKFSMYCGVLQEWNQRRKRYERKGLYVEHSAVSKAQKSCEDDKQVREEKNKKAAVKREVTDKIYIKEFATAIRALYPNCPLNREVEIAEHACQKHSGRVGRTASAKEFDETMINLAVEAHIRHMETNYDDQFGKGKNKKAIRSEVKTDIRKVLNKWKSSSVN